jgi:50S ribosomal protein L16 3-hydroxylase
VTSELHEATTMARALLAGLSPRTFLRRYWQKRPLLVRSAFSPFHDPVTPARLRTLAGQDDVESRLVRERGGARPWEVERGPLPASRLRQLGPSHWTLLVQNMDEHVPAVAALLEHFDFLPRWRVDDVMVSLAAPLGSVGPHVDTYDVFLLQGGGRRRWRIAERFDPACRAGLDLRVLRGFRAEQEWVLEPGDMLYLPPGVAHHGVALEECLTYSIGLRAPSEVDLVAGFLQRLVRSVDQSRLYADPDLVPAGEPGEISARATARMCTAVARAAKVLPAAFVRFAGDHLTERRTQREERPRAVDAAAVSLALRSGATLIRDLRSRVAFAREGEGVLLFADGRHWRLEGALARAAPALTRRRRVEPEWIRPYVRRRAFVALVAELIGAGVFRVEKARARGGAGAPARPGNRQGARSTRPASRR